MSEQLIKKGPEGYKNVMPKSWIQAIKDKETGMTLAEILQGFNMYFLSYNGNKAETRNQVPPLLRKEGLWITYVLYDHTVVSEWYNSNKVDDDSWGSDENWRVASNALVGDISVSADGYWVIDGIKTASKAQGERGTTPLLRIYDNKLQVSYTDGKTYNYIDDNPVFTQYRTYNNKIQVSRDLGKTWEDASEELAYKFKVEGNKLKMSKDLGHSWETISDYIAAQFRWIQEGTSNNIGKIQISRDEGKTWSNLTNSFSNNLHISKYIGANESLPTTGIAEGTIYMKGPYYDENDTNNDYPIYRMWVYAWKNNTLAWVDNGEFQSVVAGVVQERGGSQLNVMSQAAVTKELTELESEVDGLKYEILGILDKDYTVSHRLSKIVYLGHQGELATIKISVIEGVDNGLWRIYGTTEDGSDFDSSNVLVPATSFGESKEFIVPNNGYIYLFTENTDSSYRTYKVEVIVKNLDDKINEISSDIEELRRSKDEAEERLSELESEVDELRSQLSSDITTIVKNTGRIFSVYEIGNAGKEVYINLSVTSGTDDEYWKVYGVKDNSFDVNNVLVDNTAFGVQKTFVVPSDGKIFLFTAYNPSVTDVRTYEMSILSKESIRGEVEELAQDIEELAQDIKQLPLHGKTIVCFGDSITELAGMGGKRYSDWIAEMSGANVINVGIAGTQLRQREVISATPAGVLQSYAGIDIVNMVKSAMTNDFTIATASAEKLKELGIVDTTEIVERCSQIDWSKIDIITVFGGTNDWYNNGGNTGDEDSTDVSMTCGAVNDIIQRICSTYPNIKLYWFTPIVRCVKPDFDTTINYKIGDLCMYESVAYKFTSEHIGEWNINDVVIVSESEFISKPYFSDSWAWNGRTLKEFSHLLESIAQNNHVRVCDLYNELGWNVYNFRNFFIGVDYTHPYYGYEQIAEKMTKFIISN